jgi:site-specific recombinase XerD
MPSSDLVAAFLAWARDDRRRSAHTLARYRAVLRSVGQFGDVETITTEQVEAWWRSRYHTSAATQANELACLRSFLKWMIKFDHRIDDPSRRLDPPKIPNRMPRMIGRDDFERLLGPLTEDARELRRAFALGVYAGLRIHEAARLDWRDVIIETRRVYIRGKGGKERVAPLNPVLLDHLLPNTGGNVVTGGEQPYSADTLQRSVNRLMKRHNIDHTYHDIRKRGASMALAKGASPAVVKQVFGWSSFETVSHYAVVLDDEIDRLGEMLL